MKYRQLADTGVFVSELCLGAMTFGGGGQMWEVIGGLDQNAVDGIVHRALDAGINFIDTADVYSGRRIGDDGRQGARRPAARRRARHEGSRAGWGTGPIRSACRALHIMNAVEASLKRLGTDYIDLYQIHRFDPLTAIDDTLRALDDLVRAGKVRYIGCSNLPAWYLMKALAMSREQRIERFKCTQSYYSLAGRELEREMIPLLKDQGLGLLVWSPLAGGFLSGKFTRERRRRSGAAREVRLPAREQGEGLRDPRRAEHDRRARTASLCPQVALAWILANDAVTSVIIGAKKMAQLDDNLKSVDLTLSADDLRRSTRSARCRRSIRRGWTRSAPIAGPGKGDTNRGDRGERRKKASWRSRVLCG